MKPRVRTGRYVALATTGVLAIAACGSSGSTGGGASTPGIPTGPGVTSSKITLGVLTDLTGAFAALGKSVTQGATLFWQDQNKKGGVCGRTVELLTKDHGYNVQNAVSLYTSLQPQVLAFQELLGSPMTAALLNSIASDTVLTQPVSWSSKLLSNPFVVLSGTSYDLEMIDGLDWLMKNKGLKTGDKVGHIYLEGEYGEDGLLGTTTFAKANGLTVVPQKIQPTDKDMTAQVQAIKAAGARYIMLTSTPTQAASAVSIAEAQGFDATFMGNNPTFVPTLLSGPAKTALQKRFYLSASSSPFAGDAPGAKTVRDEYLAAYPQDTPNAGVDFGYGQAEIMYAILNAACTSGSLERLALLKAFQKLSSVDTQGLIAPLDYSKPGQPPARQAYVLQPDSAAQGGLKVAQPLFAAPLAETYKCPCL
ncbi:MAG TPA: ABC transporter substrate-binding protein [Candidatus Dormibacteraeota bacterium]|nr:ABC transporter substrate-binding protein [Candidatus Dormibacteraeota bacterium]